MVTCVNCGSEDVVLDELTGMYYCNSCSKMWDADETTTSDSYEEEDLNGFSLFVLHILMTIPIIDMIMTGVISNSSIKEQYKKTLLYRGITNMFLYTAIIVGVVIFLKESEVVIEAQISDTVDSIVQWMLPDSKNTMYNIPAVQSYEELLLSKAPKDNDVDDSKLPQNIWQYMDGVSMSGKDVIALIADLSDYDMSLLIQTKNLAGKYSSDSYRCVGMIPSAAYYNESSKNWFYDGTTTIDFEFMTDDYGEYITDSYKDIYQSKYIYYLNPKSDFTIRLLHSSDGDVIGIALLEV